jgi:transcriptional regulator with XRE-family HTH domain
MTVGENIKHYRERAGMTQEDLAQRLDITNSAVSLIESDKRGVSIDKAKKLSAILGVTLDELVKE